MLTSPPSVARKARRVCQAGATGEAHVSSMFFEESASGIRSIGTTSMGAFRFQEETVTETMLARMQLLFGDVIQVDMFGRRAESQYGADWVWVLDFGTTKRMMVVQAKKLDGPWNRGMRWQVTVDPVQHQNLVDVTSAQAVNAYYCFYGPLAATAKCSGSPSKVSFVNFVHAGSVGASETDASLRRKAVALEALCCCPSTASDIDDLLSTLPTGDGQPWAQAREDEPEQERRSRIVQALVESGSYAGTIFVNYTDRVVPPRE